MLRFAIAFLAGVAAGIALAPDKGVNTRRKIMNFPEDVSNRISKLKAKLEENLDKAADVSIRKIESVAGKIDATMQDRPS